MSEISRDQECRGSADEGSRQGVYEPPVLKRLGNIAELTRGTHISASPDVSGLST
jgi:hypothetical protein